MHKITYLVSQVHHYHSLTFQFSARHDAGIQNRSDAERKVQRLYSELIRHQSRIRICFRGSSHESVARVGTGSALPANRQARLEPRLGLDADSDKLKSEAHGYSDQVSGLSQVRSILVMFFFFLIFA